MSSPIDKLPDEIIAQILVLHSKASQEAWRQIVCNSSSIVILPEESFPFLASRTVLSEMIIVTCVSRRWRKVAMNCPEFWSFIAASSATTNAKQLELSKQAPLTVVCMLPGDSLDAIKWKGLRLILANLYRIRSFTLLIRSKYTRAKYGDGCDVLYKAAQAPLLESLYIHSLSKDDDKRSKDAAQEIGQLWDAPRLAHLGIYGGKDPFDCGKTQAHPVLRCKDTLTTFAWFTRVGEFDFCHPADTLLQVIRHLPHLQTLQLTLSTKYPMTPVTPLSDRANLNPVNLPRLRRLMLKGHIQSCFDIMDHLEHPHRLDQLAIVTRNTDRPYHPEVVRLRDLLAHSLSSDSETVPEQQAIATSVTKDIRTLGIYGCMNERTGRDQRIEIVGSSKLCHPLEDIPHSYTDYSVLYRGMYPDLDLFLALPHDITRKHFAQLFRGLSFREVEVLGLPGIDNGDGSYVPLDSWSKEVIFPFFVKVHTLVFDSFVDPDMLTYYLSSCMEEGDGCQQNLPRLKHISCPWIEYELPPRITSTGLTVKPHRNPPYNQVSGTFADLLACVQRRAESGFPLESLRITESLNPSPKAEMIALRQWIPTTLVCEIEGETKSRADRRRLFSVPENLHDEWELVEDSGLNT